MRVPLLTGMIYTAGGVAANAPGGKPGAGPVEAKTRAGFFQAPIPNVIHLFFDNPLLKPY
jgi:hypothetical protein